MAEQNNYFEKLYSVNVNDKTEKKNGLTYLSWAWSWGEIKKMFPEATYKVYENEQGWNYFTDGHTCWVKTGAIINDIEHIEYLPIMDFRNKSIPLENVTSFDVNKAIQRSLTKAFARHGLGLYIYAGEDLPEEEALAKEESKGKKKTDPVKASQELTGGGKLTDKEIENLTKVFEEKNIDVDKFCKAMKIKSLSEVDGKVYASIFQKMDSIVEKYSK